MKKYLLPFFLLSAVAVLSVVISRDFEAEAAAPPEGPLEQVLGSSREIIGDTMFLKADEYLHGGVTDKFHEHENAEQLEGFIHEPGHEAEGAPADWIESVNSRVKSHEHMHLAGDKRKEMLPFFALSTALDAHNIDAILASAYWLETDFGKTADAVRVLRKGVADNPDAWQLEDSLAGIYFRAKAFTRAAAFYEAALAKARLKKPESYEWVEMYYHLGECRIHEGRKAEALTAYKNALKYLGGSGRALELTVRQKIKALSV